MGVAHICRLSPDGLRNQSGEGNAARVLRVQGRRQSEQGLFYKNIGEES